MEDVPAFCCFHPPTGRELHRSLFLFVCFPPSIQQSPQLGVFPNARSLRGAEDKAPGSLHERCDLDFICPESILRRSLRKPTKFLKISQRTLSAA